MEQKYMIVAKCDPYHSQFHYNGQRVLKYDGATPIEWVMEDGLTEDEAEDWLWDWAQEDYAQNSGVAFYDNDVLANEVAELVAEDYLANAKDRIEKYMKGGEGLYDTFNMELIMARGDDSYSSDSMTYFIEEEED